MRRAKLQAARDEWARRHTPERAKRFTNGDVSAEDLALLADILNQMDWLEAETTSLFAKKDVA